MNWFSKFAGKARIEDMPNHIFQSVSHIVGGDWGVLETRKLMPSYRLQKYGVIEMQGANVKTEGDRYYFKCFWEINKHLNMEYPPGYFADNNPPGGKWWGPSNSQERDVKEREYGSPYEEVRSFDSQIGHKLLTFRCFAEGWRPGMMPGDEIDSKEHMQLHQYPIPIARKGDPRFDMERIDGVEGLTTPYEVAEWLKKEIDRWWNNRGGRGGDSDPQLDPTPSPSEAITV